MINASNLHTLDSISFKCISLTVKITLTPHYYLSGLEVWLYSISTFTSQMLWVMCIFKWMWHEAHLQGCNSLEHIFPHTHLHVKLRQFLVCLCARCPNLFRGTYILGEIKNMEWCYGNRINTKHYECYYELCNIWTFLKNFFACYQIPWKDQNQLNVSSSLLYTCLWH